MSVLVDQPETWPEALVKLVDACLGKPWTAERLGGMSVSRVYRVQGQTTSAIMKASPSPAEHRLYTNVATELRHAGIGIPVLFDAATVDGLYYILLEHIPKPLPFSRGADWRPDERVVAMLARLHHKTQTWTAPAATPSTWSWTPEMTVGALDELAAPDAMKVTDQLKAMEAASQALFHAECWISGDPNPLNWGERADGTPVLFDWELFGPGSPAIDLAVAIPGLGDQRAFSTMAAAYHQVQLDQGGATRPIDDLARMLGLAKAASVVQLLHAHACGSARVSPDMLDWLRGTLPAWLDEVCNAR